MNKIKVAKELIKLAKSLMANDIDEQTQARLDEAEKQGKKIYPSSQRRWSLENYGM